MNWKPILAALCVSAAVFSAEALQVTPSQVTPPKLEREFRAAWITTVWNLNWPSAKGLPVAQQKAELIALLDKAAKLHMNAVVFQVRSTCDAMYQSPYEPWSEYLTGEMGKAPSPMWDPLAFAVEAAHQRGLELHAWFNPFRARVSDKTKLSANHVSKKYPGFVREYGKMLWLDPGSRNAQAYTTKVILDIVRRYDVDGIHMDDYFYPYPEKGADGKTMDFPDDPIWKVYAKKGGKLSRADWRRENVNVFVKNLYAAVKSTKPWVKFGISPFGIWRPGYPPQIKGFDAYATIYGDAKAWLVNGWCDYLSPQLYWKIDPPEQSFSALLKWWAEQNVRSRNIWPGLNTVKVTDWGTQEIVNQIAATREITRNPGHIHYFVKTIAQNTKGLADQLEKTYATPALVPASPWLGDKAPGKPVVALKSSEKKGGPVIVWKTPGSEKARQWVLQQRVAGEWRTRVLPAGQNYHRIKDGTQPEVVAITAISRSGVASPTTVIGLK